MTDMQISESDFRRNMMMTNKRLITAALACILSMTTLVSCGAKAESMNDGGMGYDSYYAADMEMSASTSVNSKPSSAGSVNVGGTADRLTATESTEFAAKIIKTVNMDTETKEFDLAVSELDRLISEHGGFIESSSSNGQSLYHSDVYRRTASYTIRIPADRLESFLSASQQLLNVTHSKTSSQNVTTQYYDMQSRLEVLRSERDALDAMLDKAQNVEEMLDIRDRLYNVIEEIESYETQLRLYDSLVSYSTIYMNIEEVVEYTKVVAEEPTWGERLADAFKESWQDFAEGFQDFTVWLLYAIPTLMVLAVIGAVTVVILWTFIRRQKRIREAKRAEWQAKRRGGESNDDTKQE